MNYDQFKAIDEIIKLLGFARANFEHASDQPEERNCSEGIAKQQLLKAYSSLDALIRGLK